MSGAPSGDDTRQILRGPRLATDTLVGLRGRQGKDSVAVALRDVTRVEVPRSSAGGTAAVVVMLSGIVALRVAMQSMGGGISVGGS